MIKKYFFNYDMDRAYCSFTVDTNKFTEEMAKDGLDFFSWRYDKEANAIDELMKKYAIEVIRISSFYSYNASGVINDFNDKEGFFKIDGSMGITLSKVSGYEFEEEDLEITIV